MSDIDWTGGQIEIFQEPGGGWGIQHRTKFNGYYPLDWQRFKTDAIRSAKAYGKTRGARVMLEVK